MGATNYKMIQLPEPVRLHWSFSGTQLQSEVIDAQVIEPNRVNNNCLLRI